LVGGSNCVTTEVAANSLRCPTALADCQTRCVAPLHWRTADNNPEVRLLYANVSRCSAFASVRRCSPVQVLESHQQGTKHNADCQGQPQPANLHATGNRKGPGACDGTAPRQHPHCMPVKLWG
jgi:hypothetical protein